MPHQQQVPTFQISQDNGQAPSYSLYEQYPTAAAINNGSGGLIPVPNDSEVLSESDTISAITEYAGNANHVSQNAGGSPSSDDVMLAPMRAITNPTFW